MCLCCKVVQLLKLSLELLQPEMSSVLLLLSEFAVNSSKHISAAVSEVSVEQAYPEEVIKSCCSRRSTAVLVSCEVL